MKEGLACFSVPREIPCLAGTAAPAVSGMLKEGPISAVIPADGDFSLAVHGCHYLVLCPSDPDELTGLAGLARNAAEGEDMLTVALSPFDASPMFDIPVFMRVGEFALKVLEAIPGYHLTLRRESSGLLMPLWQNTGALLPFFVHNMNNILARIMGNTELAQMYAEKSETVRDKLAGALAGVEDLREYIQRLAELSATENDGSAWRPDRLKGIERTGRMFSGRSVDFSFERSNGFPVEIPCPACHLDLTVGLAAACAAVMVNGCGSIHIKAEGHGGCAMFSVNWGARPGRSGLLTDSETSAVELMATAAACCARFGFTLVIGQCSGMEGEVSVIAGDPSRHLPAERKQKHE
ncbi:MAG: hypothetical protein JXR55_06325 [Candidatus Fermentibacteraceae bacterium]|nr:hypothetical protein [Candidatus Fermentibacteraceae bacterium]